MEAFLVVALLGGFVAILGLTVWCGKNYGAPLNFVCERVQAPAIPYRRRTALFSKSERCFYQALRELVPNHMIFVKVKLADLVSLKPQHSFWEHFSPLNRKHIDFVVCDQTLAPVVAIELDDLSNAPNAGSTANLLKSVLATASLPVIHVPQKRGYPFSEMRRLLAPYLSVPRPML